MVRISKEVIENDMDYTAPAEAPIICQVRLLQDRALIPDLEMMEKKLQDVRSTA